MATTNKILNQPSIGSTSWGDPLNENADFLDRAFGDAVSFAVNVHVVDPTVVPLTGTQCQYMAWVFTGLMSVNVTYEIPSGVAGQWVVINNCTGAFDLTISSGAGGPELVMAQGVVRTIYTDGTADGVIYCDTQQIETGSDTEVLFYNGSGVGVGSPNFTYDGTALTVDTEDSGTNTVITALNVKRSSTGTPAAGIGVAIDFPVETAVDDYTVGASIKVISTDVTGGSEDFTYKLELMVAGTPTEMMTLTSAGVFTVNANAVLTAGQPSAVQAIGQAGITATADDDGLSSAFAADTYTPTPVGGNFKRIINDDAFTLAAPVLAGDYSLVIQITNAAVSPGIITLSGFSKTSGFFTTTPDDAFFVYITKCNDLTFANVVALQ